jgi:undecaprenyl-diphosphatase
MTAALETWNQATFLAMNAGERPLPLMVSVAKALAGGAVYVVMVALLTGWVRRGKALRFALLDATLAALLGLGIAVGITMIWDHPRPFALCLGHQLMAHAADASFPSDHGTLFFALSFSLLLSAERLWSTGFLALAFGVAWARIYLGVHFPLDMIGAAGVAALSSGFVRAGSPWLRGRIYPILTQIYEGLLGLLHLPKRVFPRGL